ncbi:MAG TPA: hypothetical protein VFB92_28940 [Vicinamibacterales bacterium]|jgi:hypothetical protein|nr:hypothetical protein [Vicinamibacterales bacterium]
MSRDLPAHANLDHLKKQAKELLRELQQRDPGAILADAQHQLAREYGFASWPKLKLYVDAATTRVARNPFVGSWTADLSRSKLHPLTQLHSASIGFDVAGDAVTIDYVMVDASGRTDRGLNTFVADGNERPSTQRAGYIMRARWLGSHSLEAVVSRDGEFEGRVHYVVSPDGGSLTLSAIGRDGSEQVSVFARADL